MCVCKGEGRNKERKKTMETNLLSIRGTRNQTAMADVEVSNEKQQLKGSGIVIPYPKPNKGYASKVVDLIEKLIVKWMYDCSQPHHYLAGNFAPVVDETPPTTAMKPFISVAMITNKKRILLSDIKQNPTENGCSVGYNKRQNCQRQKMNFPTKNTLKQI